MSGWGKAGYKFESTEPLPRMRMKLLKPDELDSAIKDDQGILVVDVRGDELYSEMKLPYKNMVNIPLVYLDGRLGEIPKTSKILIVCHAGKQGITAGPYLKGKGYDVAGCLDGGMMAWQKAGKAVQ